MGYLGIAVAGWQLSLIVRWGVGGLQPVGLEVWGSWSSGEERSQLLGGGQQPSWEERKKMGGGSPG